MVNVLWPKVENGEIRPTIDRVVPIEQAEKAMDLMQQGKTAGKVILTVKEGEAL